MPKRPRAPVVIVGSGAGGAMMAHALALSHGVDAIIIEAGRAYSRGSFLLAHPRWESIEPPFVADGRKNFPVLAGEPERLDPTFDDLASFTVGRFPSNDDEVDDTSGRFGPRAVHAKSTRMPARIEHVIAAGGTTLRYQAVAERQHPSVFREATLDGVGLDWPITYEDLEPWYAEAEQALLVAGPDGGYGTYKGGRSTPYPQPAHEPSYASRVLGRAARELGHTVHEAPLAVLSRDAGNRFACNYCGQCQRGCSRGDRSSADTALLPPALATGRVTLLEQHVAHEITFHDDGRARGVLTTDRVTGNRVEVLADNAVVLAAGSVATPTLLLRSKRPGSNTAPGNAGGRLGRHAIETLTANLTVRVPEPIHAYRGVPVDAHIYDLATTTPGAGYIRGFVLAHAPGVLDASGPVTTATRLAPGFGIEAKRRTRDLFGHVTGLVATGEQLTSYANSVSLAVGAQEVDLWSYPLPRVTSSLGDNDRRMLRAMRAALWRWAEAASAEVLEQLTSYDLPPGGAELRGTARMAASEDHGVTDGFGRLFDVDNLYIADASLFATGGTGNPSLTIQALARRQAWHLNERFR